MVTSDSLSRAPEWRSSPTASSVLPIVDDLTLLFIGGIALLSATRAVEIGRGLVNRIYRARAYWTAALVVFSIIQVLLFRGGFLVDGQPLYLMTFYFYLLLVLFFIDSTVLATLEMDFFHRNPLGWKRTRLLVYLAYIVDFGAVLSFGLAAGLPWSEALERWPLGVTLPQSAFGVALLVAILGYSAAALAVGARRTPDRPMRRFLKLTSFLVVLLIATTMTFDYISNPVADLALDALDLVAFYVGYLMVMSLSPTARLEKG